MNTVEFRGDELLTHTMSVDRGSNILRLHNMDTGEYEEYLIQNSNGCDLCCLWEHSLTPLQAGSCRFKQTPCMLFGFRPLKKMDKVLEDL